MTDIIQKQFDSPIESGYSLKVTSAEIFEADTRANIDIQVVTAKKYKRNLPSVLENILFIATQDKETAENCFYTLSRDGKKIRGASIRLAEIIANCYGNLRASARIIANDGRTVTAQGICWDLETNVAYSIEVKRKITDKEGRQFSEDMVVITSNACCSIALRNAIFKCVPLGITNSVQEKIKKVVLGSEQDFASLRQTAISYFTTQDVPLKSILSLFDKKTVEELTREDIFDLRGIATAIKDGDTSIEQAFSISSKSSAFSKASKILSTPIEDAVYISEGQMIDMSAEFSKSEEKKQETTNQPTNSNNNNNNNISQAKKEEVAPPKIAVKKIINNSSLKEKPKPELANKKEEIKKTIIQSSNGFDIEEEPSTNVNGRLF